MAGIEYEEKGKRKKGTGRVRLERVFLRIWFEKKVVGRKLLNETSLLFFFFFFFKDCSSNTLALFRSIINSIVLYSTRIEAGFLVTREREMWTDVVGIRSNRDMYLSFVDGIEFLGKQK